MESWIIVSKSAQLSHYVTLLYLMVTVLLEYLYSAIYSCFATL